MPAPDLLSRLLAFPSYQTAAFWDAWRDAHQDLAFAEEQELWNHVFPRLSAQRCANVPWHTEVLTPHGGAQVLELGSGDGWLAARMADLGLRFRAWHGYELCGWVVAQTVQGPGWARNTHMSRPFWELTLPPADIFVASHVLEHLTRAEVGRVLDLVAPRVTAMVLEVPYMPGRSWRGYRGSHILDMLPEDLVEEVTTRWRDLPGQRRTLDLLALDYAHNGAPSRFHVEV